MNLVKITAVETIPWDFNWSQDTFEQLSKIDPKQLREDESFVVEYKVLACGTVTGELFVEKLTNFLVNIDCIVAFEPTAIFTVSGEGRGRTEFSLDKRAFLKLAELNTKSVSASIGNIAMKHADGEPWVVDVCDVRWVSNQDNARFKEEIRPIKDYKQNVLESITVLRAKLFDE